MDEHRHNGHSKPTVSDAQLASVLDTAVDGIVVIDDNATILTFNKACEQIFGYSATEVIGGNIARLMPPEHSDKHDRYIAAYRSTGEKRIIGDGVLNLHGRRRDGTVFPIELTVGEAFTPEGRQFIGVLRDISVRKEQERRLNDLQGDLNRLNRMAAFDEVSLALAHEISQPLTAILLYLQAISKELQRLELELQAQIPVQTILAKAKQEVQRAGAIIQRVRHLGENRIPERRPLNLNDIIDNAIELTLLGQDKSVGLVRNYDQDLPIIEADPVQVQQVVVNLVRNAFDAMRGRKGARIVVGTRHDDRYAIISVADNGPGIAPDHLADLFEAFKTTKASGMGLGLAISRTIVQSHGGDLLVDPGGDGKGACFSVRLPLNTIFEEEVQNVGPSIETLSMDRVTGQV